jgi:hypothetical protein
MSCLVEPDQLRLVYDSWNKCLRAEYVLGGMKRTKEAVEVSGFIMILDKEVFIARRWLVICEDGNSLGMDRKCYK